MCTPRTSAILRPQVPGARHGEGGLGLCSSTGYPCRRSHCSARRHHHSGDMIRYRSEAWRRRRSAPRSARHAVITGPCKASCGPSSIGLPERRRRMRIPGHSIWCRSRPAIRVGGSGTRSLAATGGDILFIDAKTLLTATDTLRPQHKDAMRLLNDAGRSARHLTASGQVMRATGLGLKVHAAVARRLQVNDFLRHTRLPPRIAPRLRLPQDRPGRIPFTPRPTRRATRQRIAVAPRAS